MKKAKDVAREILEGSDSYEKTQDALGSYRHHSSMVTHHADMAAHHEEAEDYERASAHDSAGDHHQRAADHFARAANHFAANNHSQAELHMDKAERHGDAAEDVEKEHSLKVPTVHEGLTESIKDEAHAIFHGDKGSKGHIRLQHDGQSTATKHSPSFKHDLVLHSRSEGVERKVSDLISKHDGDGKHYLNTGHGHVVDPDGSKHSFSARHGTNFSEYRYSHIKEDLDEGLLGNASKTTRPGAKAYGDYVVKRRADNARARKMGYRNARDREDPEPPEPTTQADINDHKRGLREGDE
jgi:hypothetical protein